SDNYWLNTRTPALTCGLRGLVYFKINVWGPGQDLHSGLDSGAYLSSFSSRSLFLAFTCCVPLPP
ncbi:hypothetical protein B0H16DRAFT_1529978, partial [Mycena metata]